MFKPVFLKQFRQFHFFKTLGYIYVSFKIREKKYVCEKGSIEVSKEDVDKICIEVQKTSDNACGKPTLVSQFNTRHLVL